MIPANIGGQGQPERVWGQLASGNYFEVAGVQPVLGRAFLPEEDQVDGRNPVIVLGYALWQRRFGGDAGIIGKSVMLNGRQYTVIGVAPKGFTGTMKMLTSEFWAPLAMFGHLMPDLAHENLKENRDAQWLMVDARLKDGVSRQQAMVALNVVKNRIDDTYSKNDANRPKNPWTLTPAGRIPEFHNLVGLTGA